MPKNWEARQRKYDKKRYGMKVSGKSIFVIDEADAKRNRKTIDKQRNLKRKGTA